MRNAAARKAPEGMARHEQIVTRLRRVKPGSQIEDYAGHVYTVLSVEPTFPRPGFQAQPFAGGAGTFVPYDVVRDARVNPMYDWDRAREAAKKNLLYQGKLVYHFGKEEARDANARWFDAFKAEAGFYGAEIVTCDGQVYILFLKDSV